MQKMVHLLEPAEEATHLKWPKTGWISYITPAIESLLVLPQEDGEMGTHAIKAELQTENSEMALQI